MRVSELVGLQSEDVDTRDDTITVLGKGRRPRTVTFSARTGQALERYLRVRTQHKLAKLSAGGARRRADATPQAQVLPRLADDGIVKDA